jgi:hypothetical protein
MRKVVLMATLALALPTALASSTIDYATGGVIGGGAAASVVGSISAGGNVAVNSTITSVNFGPTGNFLSVGGLFNNGGGSTSLVIGSNVSGDAIVPVPERGTLGLLGTGLLGIAGVVRRKLNIG